MKSRPGRFIVLDGTEGAGKTTQIHRLKGWLAGRGISVVVTREPGGTPLAEEIRALFKTVREETVDPVTESMLLWAARRQHITQLIQPALDRGDWVICDRFLPSTFAYQVYARKLPLSEIITPYLTPVMGNLWPDATLILDLPPSVSAERVLARGGAMDRIEKEDAAFFARVHEGYRAYVDYDPTAVQIDANQDRDAVTANIRAVIEPFLGREQTKEREQKAISIGL